MGIDSPCGAGDLLSASTRHAKDRADLGPCAVVCLQLASDAGLELLDVELELGFEARHLPEAGLGVTDCVDGGNQSEAKSVRGFGHVLRVGGIPAHIKRALDVVRGCLYCREQIASERLRSPFTLTGPSPRTAATTEDGPDTTTLTSQAGPHHEESLKGHLMATPKLTAAPVRADHQPAGIVCPVFPGVCTETEPGHFEHSNHDHRVTNRDGNHILDIGFVQLSDGGPAIVYIGGMGHEDLLPEQVRAKTAELRALLDQADALADRLIATRTGVIGGTA